MGENPNHTGDYIEKLYWELVTVAREEIRHESITRVD
jgi:hypothetical protein